LLIVEGSAERVVVVEDAGEGEEEEDEEQDDVAGGFVGGTAAGREAAVQGVEVLVGIEVAFIALLPQVILQAEVELQAQVLFVEDGVELGAEEVGEGHGGEVFLVPCFGCLV
jgi:hypothetical protein